MEGNGNPDEVSLLSWNEDQDARASRFVVSGVHSLQERAPSLRHAHAHTRQSVLAKRCAVLYQVADRTGVALFLCQSVTGSWDMRDTTNWILHMHAHEKGYTTILYLGGGEAPCFRARVA